MKRSIKALLGTVAVCMAFAAQSAVALACTGIYIGPEASDDGTTIIGRSNDNADVWPNYMTVVDRVENKDGRSLPVDNAGTVYAPIPATTYKYSATPWMDSTTALNSLENDDAACANEYGVVMTMAVTAFTNEAALAADPEPEHGLTESTADNLVICQSATAREAVEVLCGLIDEYGSSESNIAIISDQKETWYVEMYTGHAYAAVKLPKDAVCVFGNEYSLEYLSSYEECIVSENLESLAKENGFAVYGKNGELNLIKTYSVDFLSYCHMRTWIGHQVLAPSTYGADYDQDTVYPLCFKADKKISAQDAFELMRNRYEGTKYSPDETGRPDMRVIGTDTAMSVHFFQIYPSLPASMSVITWESTAPCIFGVFVPLSNLCTSVSDAYSRNQPAEDLGAFDTSTYPWFAFKRLNTECLDDVRVYGKPVRAYWHQAEADMIAGMKQVLETAAAEGDEPSDAVKAYVTDYCSNLQEQAFSDAKALLNTVDWYRSKNSNTMKLGRNPETHEVINKLRVLDEIPVDLDGGAYAVVPALDASSGEASAGPSFEVIACGSVAVVVVALLAVFLGIRKRRGE